jgi:hypothetical protein
MGATAAAATLPLSCDSGFFSDAERRALGALADAVLPPDDTPGGAALGAVNYIERLCTAFENSKPTVFAGGGFSGRVATPAADGTPSSSAPANAFATPAPLDRATEFAWRLYLYGSDGVGGGPNDAVFGKVVGLRDVVKKIVAQAMGMSKTPLEKLTPQALKDVLAGLDADYRDTLVDLVSEAAFGAPEYGGNPGLAGWKMVHFEGDVQPLGFSWFDPSQNAYRERPDAPVSMANPSGDPDPLDDDTRAFIGQVVTLLGGKTFP